MSDSKKRGTSFYLSKSVSDRLKTLSEAFGMSQSEMITAFATHLPIERMQDAINDWRRANVSTLSEEDMKRIREKVFGGS